MLRRHFLGVRGHLQSVCAAIIMPLAPSTTLDGCTPSNWSLKHVSVQAQCSLCAVENCNVGIVCLRHSCQICCLTQLQSRPHWSSKPAMEALPCWATFLEAAAGACGCLRRTRAATLAVSCTSSAAFTFSPSSATLTPAALTKCSICTQGLLLCRYATGECYPCTACKEEGGGECVAVHSRKCMQEDARLPSVPKQVLVTAILLS